MSFNHPLSNLTDTNVPPDANGNNGGSSGPAATHNVPPIDSWGAHHSTNQRLIDLSRTRLPVLSTRFHGTVNNPPRLSLFFDGEPDFHLAFCNRKNKISILHNISTTVNSPFGADPNKFTIRGITKNSLASQVFSLDYSNPDFFSIAAVHFIFQTSPSTLENSLLQRVPPDADDDDDNDNSDTVKPNPGPSQPTTQSRSARTSTRSRSKQTPKPKSKPSAPGDHHNDEDDAEANDSDEEHNDPNTPKEFPTAHFLVVPPFISGILMKDNQSEWDADEFQRKSIQALKFMFPDLTDTGPLTANTVSDIMTWIYPLSTFTEAIQQNILVPAFTDLVDPPDGETHRLLALARAGLTPQPTTVLGTSPSLTLAHTTTGTDSIPEPSWANQLLQNTATMHEIMLNTTKTQYANSKLKHLYENLPPGARLVFARASAASHGQDPEPTEPFQKCVDLFNTSSRAKASSSMQAQLRAMNQRGEIQRGHLTSIIHNGLLWPDNTTPEGLTLFAFRPLGSKSEADRQIEMNTSLKAEHDNHLDDEDIQYLTKKTLHLPLTVAELEVQLYTYIASIAIFLGEHSFLAQSLLVLPTHISENYAVYTAQFEQDTLFGSKYIFQVDNKVQLYLTTLLDPKPLNTISSYGLTANLQSTIDLVNSWSLSATSLPPSIVSANAKPVGIPKKDPATKRALAKTGSQPPTKKARPSTPDPLTNNRLNPAWQVPPGKNPALLFQNKANTPTTLKNGKQTPFCLLFHTKGTCSRGQTCNLVHEDPRDLGKDAAFTAFHTSTFA
jgi:hypothetical protein